MHHFAICTTLGWCKNLHTLAPPWLKEEYYAVFSPNVDSGYHSTQEAMLLLYKKTTLWPSLISFSLHQEALVNMKSVAFKCSSEYENGYMYKTRGFQRPYLPPPSLCVQFPHSTGWHDQKFWGGFLAAGRAGPQTLVTFLISIESPMWLHIQWWRHELDLQRGTNHDLSPCPNFG